MWILVLRLCTLADCWGEGCVSAPASLRYFRSHTALSKSMLPPGFPNLKKGKKLERTCTYFSLPGASSEPLVSEHRTVKDDKFNLGELQSGPNYPCLELRDRGCSWAWRCEE